MNVGDIDESVRRLATVVSIAARIEPELLRAARLRLLPDLGASAEADLWFSDLVASRSTRRVVLDADLASALRAILAADRPLLHAARAVVAETHADAPPAIQLEEEITYLALAGGDVEEAINTKLMAVLNAIANEGRAGLTDWAARALPRLPALAQNTSAAVALRLVSGAESGGATLQVRRGVIDDPAIAALVERALPKSVVYARLIPRGSDGLAVEISRQELPASHAIALPKTEPLVLELTTANQTEVVDVPREGTLVRSVAADVSIRTIARDVFQLEEAAAAEIKTIRLLAMTGLGSDEDLPYLDADAVLIAGNVTEHGTPGEYVRISELLSARYRRTPILAVAGPRDVFEAFNQFRQTLGLPQTTFAKTLVVSDWRIGVVGIFTAHGEYRSQGSFDPAELTRACDGDPVAWCRAHHVAVLLMHHAPSNFHPAARDLWNIYGTESVFDLIVYGSSGDPPFLSGSSTVLLGTPSLASSRYLEINLRRAGSELEVTAIRQPDNVWQHTLSSREPILLVPEKVPPRRVLVAGIGEGLTVAVQELSRGIGAMLALQGHELSTGGWPGVDYLVAEGFAGAAPGRADSIRHYLGDRKQADYPNGQMIVGSSEREMIRRSILEADVVVLIDGADGTLKVGQEAIRQSKPLIPVRGGAAGRLRERAIQAWPPEARERLNLLGDPASVTAVVTILRELIASAARPQASTDDEPPHKTIFISYSHTDRKFVEEFETATEPIRRDLRIDLWDDTAIPGGTLWWDSIQEAMDRAAAAVLFVTPSYLASQYILSQELDRLLHMSEEKRLIATWFLASACRYEETPIARLQPANSVSRPLDQLDPMQRRAIFSRVVANLIRDWGEEPERAIPLYEAALRDFDKQNPEEWAITQQSYGDFWQTVGNLGRTIASYEAALQVFSERKFPIEWARTQIRLGTTRVHSADFPRAIASYEAALRVLTRREHVSEWARLQMMMGNTYLDLAQDRRKAQDRQKAVESFSNALGAFEETGERVESARALLRLGLAYERLADLKKAREAYDSSARMFDELGLADEAREARQRISALPPPAPPAVA